MQKEFLNKRVKVIGSEEVHGKAKDAVDVLFNAEIKKDRFIKMQETGEFKIEIAAEKSSDVKDLGYKNLHILIRRSIQIAKSHKIAKVIFDINKFNLDLKTFVYESIYANYSFDKYKKEKTVDVEIFIICDVNSENKKIIEEAEILANTQNICRDITNIPGSDLSPKGFVEIIKKEIKSKKLEKQISLEVWDEKKMKKENMHAVLAVGGGAHHEAQFLILKYEAGKKNDKPIVLVGKGVTFDTGGSNLKPGNAMCGMHMDMMGGAAVAATIIGAATLGMKKNIITLVPLVENRLSHRSYLPGDIITGRSCKAIEILNTDAEGRVILSDALTYATEQKPELIIDVATLTGAALIALGVRASAMFSNDDNLAKELYNIGLETKNKVWQLPVWDEYLSDIQGKYGGLTNTHKNSLGHGGSIMGAIFLKQFIGENKWAHIDIAPRMDATSDDCLAHGSTGEPTRLLLEFIKNYK